MLGFNEFLNSDGVVAAPLEVVYQLIGVFFAAVLLGAVVRLVEDALR